MENEIKNFLNTSVLKQIGYGKGGCISNAEIYDTDTGKVFIKTNSKLKARVMFDGEFQSLKFISETNVIKVPNPLLVIDKPEGGAALVMEYIAIKGLNSKSNILGDQLARLHLHNIDLQKIKVNNENRIGASDSLQSIGTIYEFGFHIKTSCGYIAQENTWNPDWPTFYARKLQEQMKMIETEYGDREAMELWSSLNRNIHHFFTDLEIKPSLLHGDLWSGNAGEVDNNPVVFDPACFYGHHEYDLAIAGMFGGFSKNFWEAYHKVIPKANNWDKRHQLYLLFHNMNHWNHFGSGYRSGTLKIMRDLIR